MERVLTGRTVLFWLLGVFGVVFAVNGIFVAEALRTFRGGDEQHPYLQGIDYNRTLERRAEQVALGWQATIDVRGRNVVVMLVSRDGVPIRNEKLEGELRHPSDANLDVPLAFREIAPGRYSASTAAAKMGSWDAIVRTHDAKKPFEASRRLWLR